MKPLDKKSHDQLADVCRRYNVRKLSIFGSVNRGEEQPNSDLDVLVEFHPGRTPGFAFIRLQDELSIVFGCQVDLNTSGDLSRYFRDSVVKEARQIYAVS
jgi:predicted nucleotidyltransferase